MRAKAFVRQPRQRAFPLGRPTRLWETADQTAGLWLEGRISQTARGDEALALVADGCVTGLSVGFRSIQETDTLQGVREISEAALFEVSLTSSPAYQDAQIVSVRSLGAALAELVELTTSPVHPGRPLTLVERDLQLLEMETRQ